MFNESSVSHSSVTHSKRKAKEQTTQKDPLSKWILPHDRYTQTTLNIEYCKTATVLWITVVHQKGYFPLYLLCCSSLMAETHEQSNYCP